MGLVAESQAAQAALANWRQAETETKADAGILVMPFFCTFGTHFWSNKKTTLVTGIEIHSVLKY